MGVEATPSKTKVLIIGSGGVGTMVAYALKTGGRADVTAVLRSNFEAVKQNGFSIDSVDHGHDIKGWRPSTILNAIPDTRAMSAAESYAFLVVTTKNIPDIPPTVVDLIEPAVKPGHTVIVLIQNGLNIEKAIQTRFPENTVLSGVQLIGVEETSPGVILHNERDLSKIGVFSGSGTSCPSESEKAQAQLFIDMYNACGKVDCQYDANVGLTRWRKLVYNASYNPVSAVLNMNTTQIRLSEHIIDDLVKPIMQEIINIALAAGYEIPETYIMDMITIDGLSSWFMPSMGQDAARGNFTEFENLTGEPMRMAHDLSVECPTLTTIYGIMKAIQTRTRITKGLLSLSESQTSKYVKS